MSNELDLIIEPGKGIKQYWRDLWQFRGLFYFLTWRDILVRYKQTVIGIAWSIIRPFLTMVVLTVIFGKLAKFPTEGGAPYPILVFAAIVSIIDYFISFALLCLLMLWYQYKCTHEHSPEDDRGIIWNDPEVNIKWPTQSPILSGKDVNHPTLI